MAPGSSPTGDLLPFFFPMSSTTSHRVFFCCTSASTSATGRNRSDTSDPVRKAYSLAIVRNGSSIRLSASTLHALSLDSADQSKPAGVETSTEKTVRTVRRKKVRDGSTDSTEISKRVMEWSSAKVIDPRGSVSTTCSAFLSLLGGTIRFLQFGNRIVGQFFQHLADPFL